MLPELEPSDADRDPQRWQVVVGVAFNETHVWAELETEILIDGWESDADMLDIAFENVRPDPEKVSVAHYWMHYRKLLNPEVDEDEG